MFILDNIMIILGFTVLLFVLFTFVNVCTFSRDLLTSAFLTFIFLDFFLRMPFKAIFTMYGERHAIIKAIDKNKKLTADQKENIKFLLQKRHRLFFAFYKAGLFSYTEQMLSLNEWYLNKPFKVKIRFLVQKKNSYESKYIRELKKDLSGIEAF